MQGENCNKLKLFRRGQWEGTVSGAPAQANNIIEYCIQTVIWLDIGPITTCNNFVFIPNQLALMFARQPEMTWLLHAKIGPFEEGMGHTKPSVSSAWAAQ